MSTNYSISNIRSDSPESGKVIVYWLGGAGFAFKVAGGEVACIDPYLSDAVERMFGFRRLSLAPIQSEDLRFDYLLFTHDHGDHLDIDSFDTLMKANTGCRIIAPECCGDYLRSKEITCENASPGEKYLSGGIEIDVIKADHGDLCPTAVGYLLKFNERCIYFTGDTAYNGSIMAPIIATAPDIVIPCINGAFGNMNEDEASTLVAQCGVKSAIPSHFWLFAEHGGSPDEFKNQAKAKSPQTQVILLTPGKGYEM